MEDRLSSAACCRPVDRPPSEIFIAIFRLLPQSDLASAIRVCRRWHLLAAPILWQDPKLFQQCTRPVPPPSTQPASEPAPQPSLAPARAPLSSQMLLDRPSASHSDRHHQQQQQQQQRNSHAGVSNSATSANRAGEISPAPSMPQTHPPPPPIVQVIQSDDGLLETEKESRRIFNLFKKKSASMVPCQDPQRETWHLFVQVICGTDWDKRPSLSQQLISRCSALLLRSFTSFGGHTAIAEQHDTNGNQQQQQQHRPHCGADAVSTAAIHAPHGQGGHPREALAATEKRMACAGATSFIASAEVPSSHGSNRQSADTACSSIDADRSLNSSPTETSLESSRTATLPTPSPPPLPYLGQYSMLIERLNLSKGYLRVTDHAIRQLAEQCPSLRVINISSCLRVTDDALIALAQHCPLEAINATSCQQLTTATTLGLAKYARRLRSLCLAGCPMTVTDQAIGALVEYCGHNLAYLRVGGSFQLTDTGLRAIAKGCGGRLRWLDVGQCPLISDRGVLALAECCPQLEWLDLTKGYPSQHQQYVQQYQQQQLRIVQLQQQWSQCQEPPSLPAIPEPPNGASIPASHHSGPASSPSTTAATTATTPPPQPELTPDVQQAALNIAQMAARFFASRTGPLPVVTDRSICKLVASCPKLRLLNLNGRGELTDATLDAVSVHCMNLRSLTISGCNKVTTDAVKRLGSDRIGWVGMSPCPNVSFTEVCAASKWKVISLQDVPKFHLNLMNGQSWDDVGTERAR
ncbi:hypothetical protein SYNPS1DRAFT_27883 [Syncephalis pseudoplumigaleata]|uniref:F-box domain-containing protein n=1 Tax=Syncephalis pseudoplumigaleata TaxID=1712513 RepID=A0A4P9Z227_9FUNG|nr:hypothetical protein SYNPS1DRAFT_27883 [Syncephalis pseudoplumigaleata]|eukprot:RKP26426.1 hypothetical protein SYNPS1DRAFT_27883 [Syncephalis pseudoplumigaleata]